MNNKNMASYGMLSLRHSYYCAVVTGVQYFARGKAKTKSTIVLHTVG